MYHFWLRLHSEIPAALERELRPIVQETLLRISHTPGSIESIIYEMKRCVDENYSTCLFLNALAAQVHLSPSYFSKLFKREIGGEPQRVHSTYPH